MNEVIKPPPIEDQIFTIRGVQVMLDRDLADLYGVEAKVLNQAVKRNLERFPALFRFQLSADEKNELVTNCDRFTVSTHKATDSSSQSVILKSQIVTSSYDFFAHNMVVWAIQESPRSGVKPKRKRRE